MKEEYPYMMCSISGFDRVPNTIALLKTEDYKLFMKYIKQAADKDPDADIIIDPDDGGECYEQLDTFMKYNISAKPIKAETYNDICHAYTKEHFGFNYVLDSVLDTIFNLIEVDLKPTEVKWFALRSSYVSWTVEEKEKNKRQVEKIDKHALCFAANGLKNCSTEIYQLVLEPIVDIKALKSCINVIAEYTEDLEALIAK